MEPLFLGGESVDMAWPPGSLGHLASFIFLLWEDRMEAGGIESRLTAPFRIAKVALRGG